MVMMDALIIEKYISCMIHNSNQRVGKRRMCLHRTKKGEDCPYVGVPSPKREGLLQAY